MFDVIRYPGNNQIKTIMRYHVTCTKMVIIQTTDTRLQECSEIGIVTGFGVAGGLWNGVAILERV